MAKQGALSALSNGGLSELWARLRFLFLAIIVYRIGAHIPVPHQPRSLGGTVPAERGDHS